MAEPILSCAYLALFLLAGFLAARRALPGAGTGTAIGLGCAFGVSFLAVLPALFALFLGFLPSWMGWSSLLTGPLAYAAVALVSMGLMRLGLKGVGRC